MGYHNQGKATNVLLGTLYYLKFDIIHSIFIPIIDNCTYLCRSLIQENDPICCYFDDAASKYVVEKFHGKEIAYIDNVRLCCGLTADSARACITFRVPVSIKLSFVLLLIYQVVIYCLLSCREIQR